jgi:hypothetical protein
MYLSTQLIVADVYVEGIYIYIPKSHYNVLNKMMCRQIP